MPPIDFIARNMIARLIKARAEKTWSMIIYVKMTNMQKTYIKSPRYI